MQQIRFDFLGSVNGGSSRTNGNNTSTAQTGDAFAQILDQQLTRRADADTGRRAADPRARSDASDRADGKRPQVLKRRDAKDTGSATAGSKSEAASAKPAPKTEPTEKTAAERDTCGKPATKPQPDETDETTEAAAGTPAATEGNGSSGTTETEEQPDTSEDANQQQQNDGTQQQASDGTDQGETAAESADLSLLAMLAVPLPLQAIASDVSGEAAPPLDGDNAAAALQAGLAASLAGSIDLGATASGKVPAQTAAGGLKFGAILNAGIADPQQGGTDALTALQGAAEELAKAADPLAQPAQDANGKPKDSASPGAKARDAAQDKAAATVDPEANAKAVASIIQPTARASAVTWSGTTNVRNELAESMAVQAGATFASDDAEFSNWSQVLGSGASGLGGSLSARQTAFMTQMRQNLQNLPVQEQIAVQIKGAMQNGNSRVTVALHPVELGRVEVKLDIDKDKNVTATIVVDRPATLDLLRNDAKALERALQDAGLQTGNGSLSFNLRDSNGQNGGGAQNGTGTGGSGSGTATGGSDVRAETARPDVVATADGYVDLET
ncbi:flagellar hook-length control protein FliK [Dongia sedimenti]|uniref:Flagellar hook-length control protein FliK n=1 Tax=Dongia sedimenti TaxID=3064282 RepID=A0ABU0YHI0_9PROT|nr:flagellar hook-length control protein FliK [Rhodospirillaceae bacterium R-7]